MPERTEAARLFRNSAKRLRAIAGTQTALSSELVRMAEDMESEAAKLETAARRDHLSG